MALPRNVKLQITYDGTASETVSVTTALLERLLHTQSNQEIHCGQFPRDFTAVERSIRKFIMQMQI